MVIFIILVNENGDIVNVKQCSPDNFVVVGTSLQEVFVEESFKSVLRMLKSACKDTVSSETTQMLVNDKVVTLTLYAITVNEHIVVIGFDNGTADAKIYDEFIHIYNEFANKMRNEFNSAIKVRERSISEQFEEIQSLNNELINTKRKLEKNNFAINKYNLELKELYQQLNQEISKAKKIHENSLPLTLPVVKGIEISAYYQPASKMGGDYYNAVKIKGKLVFYVSDVSGHSLDGAMLSVFVKITINNYLSLAKSKNITPAKIIKYVFEQYNKENYPEDYFVCLQVCVLDLKSYELTHAGCGFYYPGMYCIDGNTKAIESGGLPISNAYPIELLDLQESSILLSSNSSILILTDGLIEEEFDGEQYGVARIEKVFMENSHLSTNAIKEKINEDYSSFTGNLKNQDDITYLIIQTVDHSKKKLELTE